MPMMIETAFDDGARVQGTYRVLEIGSQDGGTGEGMHATLGDACSTWPAFASGDAAPFILFAVSPGDVVHVEASLTPVGDGTLALNLSQVDVLPDAHSASVPAIALLPRTLCPAKGALNRFIGLTEEISQPYLAEFLSAALFAEHTALPFLQDPHAEGTFFDAPGGLFRHSVDSASIVAQLDVLEGAERELAIVAALLYDIAYIRISRLPDSAWPVLDIGNMTLEMVAEPLRVLTETQPELAMALRYILGRNVRTDLRGEYPFHFAAEVVRAAHALSVSGEGHRLLTAA